ncbi:hypothetical protein DFP72DRAFT_895340 [Ephemerocybe angulata]|uniref:Zn(2)-C6 fungal-type domain-containing protein n=1 Tax=Ephemerocybe angulata TaxID=980116 RepID=A0A8H6I1U5_9AGAR|nr:hypothetical protein DFP72DRAFT_895340 [Tulosesus angulatus]
MNPADRRIRLDDQERAGHPLPPPYGNNPHAASAHEAPDGPRPEFTLLVAGCRGGKTSFLRLLLDTCDISPNVTKDQLASVAKFVQGAAGHTSYIRSATLDIEADTDGNGSKHPLGLTLIDTPSFDFSDEQSAERAMMETLHHVDSRFADGIGHAEVSARPPLAIIVPPSVPGPPAPVVPRTRNGSFSQPDQEPVILEPPVATNPLLFRAALPKPDITAIRRLSGRVNVAIRRDLAEAGIGFGIFDMDGQYGTQHPDERVEPSNGYANGASTSNNSPPTSPVSPAILRLPYALISPDMYSHSDGVPRRTLSRHELIQQYSPSQQYPPPSKLSRGKFIRSYRWGTVDVLDPAHSDFLSLRSAIFHHMDTLQKYTREYLFEKFKAEYAPHHAPASRHSVSQIPHVMGPIPSGSRPILAIDTAAQPPHRHPIAMPAHPTDLRPGGGRPMNDGSTASGSVKSSGPRTTKQRTKKITVACNFCRSRKLKCDGGRPACGQCLKRSNPCDYMPQNKRRGTISRTQRPKGEESESDSGDERSPEPSASPEVPSQPVSRRSSNVDKLHPDGYHPPPPGVLPPMNDRPYPNSMGGPSAASPPLPAPPPPPPSHFQQAKMIRHPEPQQQQHAFYPDHELPHITTLLPPDSAPSTPVPMSAPNNLALAPIRPANDQQALLRKRAATVPNKSSRGSGSSGPKVVACNFCRARKTKCDGAHPACASCARRQLACNYVHDAGGPGPKKRRASTSKTTADSPPESLSPPSSRMIPTPSTGGNDHGREMGHRLDDDLDLKRPLDHHPNDMGRVAKKMRMEETLSIAQ